MRRVVVICEGKTEQQFCDSVLGPMLPTGLWIQGITSPKGGSSSWQRYATALRQALAAEGNKRDVWFTTMIDLYQLPTNSPGFKSRGSAAERISKIEQAINREIGHPRFRAHLSLHEIEALLFADRDLLEQRFGQAATQELRQIKKLEPEGINLTRDGCPSRRIGRIWPGYESRKVTRFSELAQQIGLDKIRAACPHFNQWMSWLESLAT